jgi:Alr-MurF fusion protein
MMYTSKELVHAVQGEAVVLGHAQAVTHVTLDSRKLSLPSSSVFFAISGVRHDAHLFLEEVYHAGVRVFITEKPCTVDMFTDATVIRVPDSIAALQRLAAHRRQQFHIPVIGITGSNGKTVVKEWLNLLLSDDFHIVRSPKSYNSQVGVALSVLNMESYHTLGLFEAGISEPGEMASLAAMIRPTLGVITTIGVAHLENFGQPAAIAAEKVKLFSGDVPVVYSADQPAIASVAHAPGSLSWSFSGRGDVQLQADAQGASGTLLRVRHAETEFSVSVPFRDAASLENAASCITVMLKMGYGADRIAERLPRLVPVSMRLELLQGAGGSILVNDTYSNDLQSLEIALDFARQQSSAKPLVAVLSDIVQSGVADRDRHRKIAALLQSKGVAQVYGVGSGFAEHEDVYGLPHQWFPSVANFTETIRPEVLYQKVILVKGARELKFERIVSFLQQQTHETVLQVDLSAMEHNLNYFRSKVGSGVKIMAMVKASGYGAGAHEVASLLAFNKIDYLAVAYTDEGVSLRQSGISLPIMVMNPERSSLHALLHHHLEPEIYSFRSLDQYLEACAAGEAPLAERKIHIKVNTGMNRLGFEAEEMAALGVRLQDVPGVRVVSVFTHLAASEDAKHDGFTATQLKCFDEAAAILENALGYGLLRHVGNTGAIQRFPQARYDMVRLGIGLYGISAVPSEQGLLRQVSSLKTVVSQLRTIGVGESVGYGRSFVATVRTTVATIPVGYADGLKRLLGNGGGEVLIRGVRCAILGRVCMDMTMVDVTGLEVNEGDEVTVFGEGLPIQEFAERCQTIPYEVLTSIPARVKRVYLQE